MRKKPVEPGKTKEQEEEEMRKLDLRSWMDAISSVFAEAEPMFKKQREKTNKMSLKRTMPEGRNKESISINNPSTMNLRERRARYLSLFVLATKVIYTGQRNY